eukprot:SAG31_NODE_356_length_17180_cov_7.595925_2_plen_160_part_00
MPLSAWEIDNRYQAHLRALHQVKPTLSTKNSRHARKRGNLKDSPGKPTAARRRSHEPRGPRRPRERLPFLPHRSAPPISSGLQRGADHRTHGATGGHLPKINERHEVVADDHPPAAATVRPQHIAALQHAVDGMVETVQQSSDFITQLRQAVNPVRGSA